MGKEPAMLAPLKECIEAARKAGAVIVYTRDWHPENHSSFEANGGPWPVHCVAETEGAELMPPLRALADDLMIHKGLGVDGAGYSGFERTGLDEHLKKLGVGRIAVSGIATEYCVRATALDGLKAGSDTGSGRGARRSGSAGNLSRRMVEGNLRKQRAG